MTASAWSIPRGPGRAQWWSARARTAARRPGLDRYGHLFPDELVQLAERLQEAYVDAVADRARTDAASGAAGNGKGAGR
jgi:hypothetical protein